MTIPIEQLARELNSLYIKHGEFAVAKHVKSMLIEARIEELENLNLLDMGVYYEMVAEGYDRRLADLQNQKDKL